MTLNYVELRHTMLSHASSPGRLPPERLKPSIGTVAWMPPSRVQTSQRPALYSMALQAACPRHACLHSSAQFRSISHMKIQA